MDILGGEDRVLWGRMMHLGKYANLSMPLLNYRILPHSLSHVILGSPYSFILRGLREKMAKDKEVCEYDIQFHNEIYSFTKKSKPTTKYVAQEVSKLNILYNKLSKFIKPTILERSIIFMKNVYGVLFLR